MNDVDDKIMWLAGVICSPTRRDATRAAFDKIIATGRFRAVDMPTLPRTDHFPRGFAEWARRHDHHVLALAFDLVALSTDDAAAAANIVADANGLLCSADGDTREARARLRVWDDVAHGKYDAAAYGDDFFKIAEMYWRSEMPRIVASPRGAPMRDRFQHPALQILMFGRWDNAFAWLHSATEEYIGAERAQDLLDTTLHDTAATQSKIADIIEYLYSVATPRAGARALAWEMLTADPRKPHSFSFLPQLQCAIDNADLEAEDDVDVSERIRIWWRAAEGEWTDSEISIFRIADVETRPGADDVQDPEPELHPQEMIGRTSATLFADLGLPTLVVMPNDKSSKLNNFHSQYRDLVDAALPLVVVRDVKGMRAALHAEFPHATVAVDLMLRDLSDGKPFFVEPICLVSAPGAGKSRLVRRVADLVRNLYLYRFDASSSSDSHFGGTSKAWSNTEASVPARAVAQSKTANPIALVDEIDKAAANHNGSLHSALLPFLDRETASRYRDQSLDAELDLSFVSYIATANSVEKLPSPLRDRFRIIKLPSPTLQHLPQLASQVMKDLANDDESRQHDAPLAEDELAVMAKPWERSRFSMRSLQKIVSATLDARDSYAMRH